jgi:hypothetical protein
MIRIAITKSTNMGAPTVIVLNQSGMLCMVIAASIKTGHTKTNKPIAPTIKNTKTRAKAFPILLFDTLISL